MKEKDWFFFLEKKVCEGGGIWISDIMFNQFVLFFPIEGAQGLESFLSEFMRISDFIFFHYFVRVELYWY